MSTHPNLKRWLLRAVGALAVVLVVAIAMLHQALQRQLPIQLLRGELERAIGLPVQFKSFQLSWDARLRLRDVEIREPEGGVFLRIPEARVDFDRGEALRGRVQVLQLHLQHPRVDLNGPRWRRLSQIKGASGGAGRKFPITLADLAMHWLDDADKPAWQVEHWSGSLPPVPAGRWQVRLQGAGAKPALVEGQGDSDTTELKLERFPVAALASLSTGAEYPNLEPSAQVDLQGERRGSRWLLSSKLRSRVYDGPIDLTIDLGSRTGKLSLKGGRLQSLGQIHKARLEFAPHKQGWKISDGGLVWAGADWKFIGSVDAEDQFIGELSSPRLVLKGQEFHDLKLLARGSAQQRKATFAATGTWGKWPASLIGNADESGIPKANWSVSRARGSASWASRSGALRADLQPVDLSSLWPTVKGRLQGRVQHSPAQGWQAWLQSERVRFNGQRLEAVQLKLQQPNRQKARATWSGGGRWNGRAINVSGFAEEPQLEVVTGVSGLTGQAKLRLNALLSQRIARLQVVEQDLKYRNVAVPKLLGSVRLDQKGLQSEKLRLEWNVPRGSGTKDRPALRSIPLELSGDFDVTRRSLRVGVKPVSIALAQSWLSSAKIGLPGLDGKVSGDLLWSAQRQSFKGKLTQLSWKQNKLGDWQLNGSKTSGKAMRLQARNSALVIPKLGKVTGDLDWVAGKSSPQLTLTAPKLDLPGGLPRLGPSRLSIRPAGTGVLALSGTLGSTPPSKFSGQAQQASQRIRLSGKLAGVKVLSARLSGQWSASGSWNSPDLRFQGSADGLQVAGFKPGAIPLTLNKRTTPPETRIQAGPLPLDRLLAGSQGEVKVDARQEGGAPMKVSASLRKGSFKGRPVADVDASGVLKGQTLEQAVLTWKLDPPLVVRGTLGARCELHGKLAGQSLQALSLGYLPVTGVAQGSFSYANEDGLRAQADLQKLEAAGQGLGQGKLELSYRQGRLAMNGQQFDAARLDLLQQRYPGLTGELSFDVQSDLKQHKGTLKLRNANWKNRSFPDATVRASGADKVWDIESASLALNPPLQARGQVVPASSKLDLAGRLEGQSLADLSLLGGGNPPPDVTAQLAGPFELHAQGKQLQLTFQGVARSLSYRGMPLGEGDLRLRSDPNLDGQLILRQPVELGQTGAVPPALQAVLPVQNVLSALRLRGVQLSGALQSPKVSPLWAAPDIRVGIPRNGQGVQVKVGRGLRLRLPFP